MTSLAQQDPVSSSSHGAMDTLTFVNATPHDVTIVRDGTVILTFPRTTVVARVAITSVVVGKVAVGDVTIPVTRQQTGAVQGLPDPQPGLVYIVSRMVAQAVQASGDPRQDLCVPDQQVRNDQGQVIGCQALDFLQ